MYTDFLPILTSIAAIMGYTSDYATYMLYIRLRIISSSYHAQVLDISSNSELAYFPGVHSKARLFRSEGGVRDMQVMPGGHLYSCGGDGAIRFRSLSGVH